MGQSPRVFPTNKGPKFPPVSPRFHPFRGLLSWDGSERRKRWYVVSTLEPPKGPKINGTETQEPHQKKGRLSIRLQKWFFQNKGLVWGLLGFKPLPVLFVPTNSILSGVTRGVEDSKKTSCLFALKVPGRPLIQQGLFWKRPPLILVRIHTMELGTILLVIGLTYRFSLKCWW